MFFLKIIDDQDQQLELMQDDYQSPIPAKYQWRNWAADAEGITGEALMAFINTELFPALKDLLVFGKQANRIRVVKSVFEDAYNYMKSGQLMRQVINKISTVDFNDLPNVNTLATSTNNCSTTCKAPAMPANITHRAPSPPSWSTASIPNPAKFCSIPVAVPVAF